MATPLILAAFCVIRAHERDLDGDTDIPVTIGAEIDYGILEALGLDPDEVDISCRLLDSTGDVVDTVAAVEMSNHDSKGRFYYGDISIPVETAAGRYFVEVYVSDDIDYDDEDGESQEIDKDDIAPCLTGYVIHEDPLAP